MKEDTLVLKDNSLHLSEEESEFFEIKPELVYVSQDGEIPDENDGRELAALEPLVEYTYTEDQTGSDPGSYVLTNHVKTELIEQSNETAPIEGAQILSVISNEDNAIEPMMPFFLTSQPIFTIMNENIDPLETIVLQVENQEMFKKDSEIESTALEDSLCNSQDSSTTSIFTCDICHNTYGCMNCLKSHYKTIHFGKTLKFKCPNGVPISKLLVCPVCDLCFNNRSTTMDHYITHSVCCDLCGSGFDRQQYLIDHLKSVHNKGGLDMMVYECELCISVYQYAVNLTRHYQLNHNMILCHVCKLRFASTNDLAEHQKIHWQKFNVLPYACSKCDMAFPKISDIAVHIREDHSRTYKRQMPVEKSEGNKKILVNRESALKIEKPEETCMMQSKGSRNKKVK